MQQCIVSLALERSRREHLLAVERRHAAVESTQRFEKSFGYICVCTRGCRCCSNCTAGALHGAPGHELRNPLHGICAGVEALRDGTLAPAEAHEELASITEGLKLMVSITNDMTDLQKLRAGQFAVQLAPTSLRRVLESCVLAALPLGHSARHGAADVPGIQLFFENEVPESVSGARVAISWVPLGAVSHATVTWCWW